MDGRIVKGVGGFYYVLLKDNRIIECRASGLFRKKNIKPTIGDNVSIRFDTENSLGYIEEIYKRNNEIIRPYIANADQIVIVASVETPEFNHWLVDRLSLMFKFSGITPLIVISKCELNSKMANLIKNDYILSGYNSVCVSSYTGEGIDLLKEMLANKVSVLAGVSGAGKSTLINSLGGFALETGEVSKKTDRGKHTTRHSEWLILDDNTVIIDTPGFSSIDIDFVENIGDLKDYYHDFHIFESKCKFVGCDHINEPSCAVKQAVIEGKIPQQRYDNYKLFYEEIKNNRRF